jgi:hypothetical protein
MLRVPGVVLSDIVIAFAATLLLTLALVIADTPFILATVPPVIAAFRSFLLSIVTPLPAGVIRDEKVDVVDFSNCIFRGNYRGS